MPRPRLLLIAPLAGPALAAGLSVLAAWAPGVARGQVAFIPPASTPAYKALLTQCWKPDALAARPGEQVSRRSGRKGAAKKPVDGARMAPPRPARGSTSAAALRLPSALRGSIRRVALPRGQKLIALTFDAGEANGEVAGYDGAIVDYLRAHRIKATFFLGGKWMETHPARTAQLIADTLFEIGNHGWSHLNMRKAAARILKPEIGGTQAAYERARAALAVKPCATVAAMDRIPRRMTLYRFPFGTCKSRALKAASNTGLLSIQWDVVTGDPDRKQTAVLIAKRVLRNTRPGSIIVAHANGRGWHTAKSLPLFVPKLRAKGYRFVTVTELLFAGRPVIARTCYETRPGDNRHY